MDPKILIQQTSEKHQGDLTAKHAEDKYNLQAEHLKEMQHLKELHNEEKSTIKKEYKEHSTKAGALIADTVREKISLQKEHEKEKAQLLLHLQNTKEEHSKLTQERSHAHQNEIEDVGLSTTEAHQKEFEEFKEAHQKEVDDIYGKMKWNLQKQHKN